MADESQKRLFHEEPVDISRKYGLGMIVAGAIVQAIHHLQDPVLASHLGAVVVFTAGFGFVTPYGNHVIQWRGRGTEGEQDG